MSARNFALPPIGKPALVFAFLLGIILPLGMAVGMIWAARNGQFPLLAAVMLQAVVALTMLAVLLPMWRRQVAIDGRRLSVKATYYTRSAGLEEFDLAGARVVDLAAVKELRPAWKSNGFALPGFWAGHFRLRDWRKQAFCLVTDGAKVLALPHADGRVWLLSFEHPQAVLDILRRAA